MPIKKTSLNNMCKTVLAVRTDELNMILGSRPFVALPQERDRYDTLSKMLIDHLVVL